MSHVIAGECGICCGVGQGTIIGGDHGKARLRWDYEDVSLYAKEPQSLSKLMGKSVKTFEQGWKLIRFAFKKQILGGRLHLPGSFG